MTDFEEGRASVLADRRARGALAEVEAAIVGDDVVLAEFIQEMQAAIRSWHHMRAALALAVPRFELGDYDEGDVADRRENYAIALMEIDKLARQIAGRRDELREGGRAS